MTDTNIHNKLNETQSQEGNKMRIETIKTIKLENNNTSIIVTNDNGLSTVTLKGEHIIKNQENYSRVIGCENHLCDVIENLTAIDGGQEDVNECLKYNHEPIHWESLDDIDEAINSQYEKFVTNKI